jgi:hypothetical protein
VPVSLGTVSMVGGIDDLAVDDTNVYLSDEGGQLIALPVVGGSATVLATVTSAYNEGLWLALGATDVYFSGGGTVGAVPKGGGATTVLASTANEGIGIALAGGTLYWTESFTDGTKPGDILRVPASGGSPQTVASNLDLPIGLVTDGTSLYFITSAAIDEVSTSGGAVTTLAPMANAQVIATDGTNVYWAVDDVSGVTCGICPPPPPPKPTDSTVYRMPVAGGTPTAIATGYLIDAVATDGTNAYWFDAHAHTLSTVPVVGGTPTVLATGVGSDLGPVVYAGAIYWVATNGEVMRMPTSHG